VAVAPRLPLRLGGDWQGTTLELPPGAWRDELTGEEVEGGPRPIAELLARFPVALLARLKM
jgi:(1->4)-alpha-D-glucan 1-alpha-D-glucosylmutase